MLKIPIKLHTLVERTFCAAMDKGSKNVGESRGSDSNEENTCRRDSAYWDKVMAEALQESERRFDEIPKLVRRERRRRFFRRLFPCFCANETEQWY